MIVGRTKNGPSTWLVVGISVGLALAGLGCGGSAPRAVEVSEEWTSGDERALGIEAPAQAAASDAAASDATASEASRAGDD
jgi:hypothetical protein